MASWIRHYHAAKSIQEAPKEDVCAAPSTGDFDSCEGYFKKLESRVFEQLSQLARLIAQAREKGSSLESGDVTVIVRFLDRVAQDLDSQGKLQCTARSAAKVAVAKVSHILCCRNPSSLWMQLKRDHREMLRSPWVISPDIDSQPYNPKDLHEGIINFGDYTFNLGRPEVRGNYVIFPMNDVADHVLVCLKSSDETQGYATPLSQLKKFVPLNLSVATTYAQQQLIYEVACEYLFSAVDPKKALPTYVSPIGAWYCCPRKESYAPTGYPETLTSIIGPLRTLPRFQPLPEEPLRLTELKLLFKQLYYAGVITLGILIDDARVYEFKLLSKLTERGPTSYVGFTLKEVLKLVHIRWAPPPHADVGALGQFIFNKGKHNHELAAEWTWNFLCHRHLAPSPFEELPLADRVFYKSGTEDDRALRAKLRSLKTTFAPTLKEIRSILDKDFQGWFTEMVVPIIDRKIDQQFIMSGSVSHEERITFLRIAYDLTGDEQMNTLLAQYLHNAAKPLTLFP